MLYGYKGCWTWGMMISFSSWNQLGIIPVATEIVLVCSTIQLQTYGSEQKVIIHLRSGWKGISESMKVLKVAIYIPFELRKHPILKDLHTEQPLTVFQSRMACMFKRKTNIYLLICQYSAMGRMMLKVN